MRQTKLQWTVLLALVAIMGSTWVVYSREPVNNSDSFFVATEAAIVGHFAPEFALQQLDGTTMALDDFVSRTDESGKPMVINFWATWCGPCRIEMPHLDAVHQQFGDQVAIVGINQNEGETAVSDFVNELGLTFPILLDSDFSVNNRYGIHSLPTTVFVDEHGVVQEVILGSMSQAVLEERILRLMEN